MVTTTPFFHRAVNKIFPADTELKKNPTLLIVVAAALIREDGRILLQKRPEGRQMAGLWEFPGGKLEEGESPEAALTRELAEELGILIESDDLVPACFASEPLEQRNLLLMLFTCSGWQGNPTAIEGQEIGWFGIDEMYDLPMPPADLPLIRLLQKLQM